MSATRKTSAATSVPYVVGVGASAGGLDALSRFLGNVPPLLGVAFVVVQHQDPAQPTELPALLQRITAMPVEALADRVRLAPNKVYVAPAGHEVSLLHGVVELFEQGAERARSLPIDFFFRALAADLGDRCAAVVLSGMGADGSQGIVAVEEAGGAVLVQEPSTAAFASMPESAIDTGLASLVASPEDLARAVGPQMRVSDPGSQGPEGAAALEKVAVLLRARTGNDFSFYKKSVLMRRIGRRMMIHQISELPTYVRYLRENTTEQDLLFKELLIGVTRFFRDAEAWTELEQHVIPELLRTRPPGRPLRVWCAGCSTGEEAYSMAILLREAMARLDPAKAVPVRIFATDLDPDAIERARRGLYPDSIQADVGESRLRRWFLRDDGGGFRVGREIREMVTLAVHNVLRDPPFTRLDLVTCRNLLIYLEPEAQKRLFPLFHYCLEPDGVLFLGSAEALGSHASLFAPLDRKWRVFQKKGSSQRITPQLAQGDLVESASATQTSVHPPPAGQTLQAATDRLLLDRFCPPAVLVTGEGDILYVSGRTGKYLEPAAGRANWNVFAMARDGLREELSSAFRKAVRRGSGTMVVRGVAVRGAPSRKVDLTIHVVEDPASLQGTYLIGFEDAAPSKGKPKSAEANTTPDSRRAEAETRRLQRELQSLREDMQSSTEELKSANEELQSTNEELQSSNEELTTSTEELQSLNEELQTINAELQSKIDEVSRTNNDMKNLLDSTDIATLFLDGDLCVRRFTPRAARLFKLRPSDLGRPITDIASSLVHPTLDDDVSEVLRTLVFSEREVGTVDGRWFLIRTMPYRTYENVIDGVVITFIEITRARLAEAELERMKANRDTVSS